MFVWYTYIFSRNLCGDRYDQCKQNDHHHHRPWTLLLKGHSYFALVRGISDLYEENVNIYRNLTQGTAVVPWVNIWGLPRHLCFVFERARAPRYFLFAKRHPMIQIVKDFKGTKAMTRGHGGNCLCCLSEVSGLLQPIKTKPVVELTTLRMLSAHKVICYL